MKQISLTLTALVLASAAMASDPEVLDVKVGKSGMAWRVDVTVEHPDTGWDHYVDGWEVLDKDGNRLGYRVLHHPHVNEQPFTRSLTSLTLPDGTREIFVKAHCSVDGWSGEAVRVELKP
ncbi:hypothetical protein SAMN04487859_104160 [Roseovarius lutimaris]|uniref:Uncharacterized protein n=1 Tax=Roseovarius lutimaris TaxID=1005928 RepID=A0A1I4ZVT6_9RHOB|nr:hypothetical protein [Roseovarius lutimaris]SFN54354.1 hypothetical protein SAMN04487859_104160 [Roseovarius lutimaris]